VVAVGVARLHGKHAEFFAKTARRLAAGSYTLTIVRGNGARRKMLSEQITIT
jgi:hypothetical protein